MVRRDMGEHIRLPGHRPHPIYLLTHRELCPAVGRRDFFLLSDDREQPGALIEPTVGHGAENMMESIVDERHGGPPDGVGEGDSSPCDAWGGQERAASLCARICTAACIVGVACACAAVGTFVATVCSAFYASFA